MAMVREAKAVQVWNADVGALILYPGIRSYFRAQLLINCSRVLDFSKLMLLVVAGRLYLDRYADFKATTNPLSLCIDNTGVSSAESQVVPDKCWNDLNHITPSLPESMLLG